MNLLRSDSENFKATYENYEVACPSCQKWNVFNRITDLKSIGVACGKKVKCLYCKSTFVITVDDVDEQYEYFLNDCEDLIKQKKYMYCILNLCQACEAFFMKCIDIKLLWEPYKRFVFGRSVQKHRIFDEYYEMIHDKFRDFAYKSLLNIVFDLYLNNKSFNVRNEIEDYLEDVREYAKHEPSDDEIQAKSASNHSKILLVLKQLNINEVRNDVVHKDGYRPSRNDVEHYHNQVVNMIENLKVAFDIGDMLEYCKISNVIDLVRK